MIAQPSVLTYGEGVLKLQLPPAQRLENFSNVTPQFGGAELNVAAALSSMGTPATWISALPVGPLGDWMRHAARGLGVSVQALEKPGRLGTYYLEDHHAPRPSRVVYDRAGSAFTYLTGQDFDPSWLAGQSYLHVTGISLAVGAGPAALALQLMAAARQAGLGVSFDVNHRRLLLPEVEAREAYTPAVKLADLLLVADRDLGLFGGLAGLRAINPAALIVQTLGAAGSRAHLPDGQTVTQAAIPATGPGRIGRGDAFAGAFLHAHLHGENPAEALAFASAAASLKTTTPGDQLQASAEEVRAVLRLDLRSEPQR